MKVSNGQRRYFALWRDAAGRHQKLLAEFSCLAEARVLIDD